MSRSYKLRHLSKNIGGAKKYVSCGSFRRHVDKIDNALWYEIAHEIYGLPCKMVERPVDRYCHKSCIEPKEFFGITQWRATEVRDIFNSLKRNRTLYSIKNIFSFNWIGHHSVSKDCRIMNSRRARRITKLRIKAKMLKKDIYFEDVLPTNKKTIQY